MDFEEQSFCSNCGEGGATFFIVSIVLGEKRSRGLCKKCYQQWLPESPIHQALEQEKCRFCGAQAAATDSFARLVNGSGAEEKFLCRSCSGEYYQAASGFFDSPSGLDDSNIQERLGEIMEQIDTHMDQWVRQRDN